MSELEKKATKTKAKKEVAKKPTKEKAASAAKAKKEKVAETEEVKAEVAVETPKKAKEKVKAETPKETKKKVKAETPKETEEKKAEEDVAFTAQEEEVKAEESIPVEFDWDSLEKKQDNYSSEERSKLEDLYSSSLSSIVEHEVIEGTVVGISNREVVINIGYKSDGIIPFNEFRYNPDLKVSDKVDIYVENQEDSNGQMILSHKKARILKSWDRINEAHDKEEVINGYVKCRTKGGLIVDVFGIEAFLPGSQIDVKPIRDYDIYVDKTMEFKVVKINHEYKNVVVSHKALIEDELEQQRSEIIAKLEQQGSEYLKVSPKILLPMVYLSI